MGAGTEFYHNGPARLTQRALRVDCYEPEQVSTKRSHVLGELPGSCSTNLGGQSVVEVGAATHGGRGSRGR